MRTEPLLVLLGDSLILDSVEASLTGDQAFSVIRLRSAHPEIAERLRALAPNLIIFDLDARDFHSIIPFLKARSGVPLLGIDVNGNIAVSLTCTHHRAQNQGDLRAIVNSYIDPVSTSRSQALSRLTPPNGD
jgi:hypothetical protein